VIDGYGCEHRYSCRLSHEEEGYPWLRNVYLCPRASPSKQIREDLPSEKNSLMMVFTASDESEQHGLIATCEVNSHDSISAFENQTTQSRASFCSFHGQFPVGVTVVL
jgi:hypothetical protein